jgi:pimeloyl-ACP methyl ester carboxylesterase
MPNEPGAYAPTNGIQVWYRDEGDPTGEPILLIMGLSSQLIAWPDDLVAKLGARGYRVIRFDNRDCGLSQKIDSANPDPLKPAYHLVDMAMDTVGLLDHLGIEQAHVVGASMGGMIAQLIAIHQPRRVRTLCSIMSTTGAPLVGLPTPEAALAVLAPVPPERDKAIAHIANVYRIIGSRTHEAAERANRLRLAELSYDRMFYPPGGGRQFQAIATAKDRTAELGQLTMPSLVIHGVEDSLITITGGRATHQAISGSTYLELDTMGHDLPEVLRPQIIDAIHANAAKRSAAMAKT